MPHSWPTWTIQYNACPPEFGHTRGVVEFKDLFFFTNPPKPVICFTEVCCIGGGVKNSILWMVGLGWMVLYLKGVSSPLIRQLPSIVASSEHFYSFFYFTTGKIGRKEFQVLGLIGRMNSVMYCRVRGKSSLEEFISKG